MPNRRDFLKFAAVSVPAGLVPIRRVAASQQSPCFHYIQIDTLHSWSVPDPVSWALANRRHPMLDRAAEGLSKRTEDEGDRVIRLVVRRCRLNLLELRPGTVVVHYWADKLADLRPFFKQHQLARPEIIVQLRNRRREINSTQPGDDFLFGSRLAADFPLDLFHKKFANRFKKESDDWQDAPHTQFSDGWRYGLQPIPWAALKSAWRRSAPGVCLNCDTPTWLINFGVIRKGFLTRLRVPNYVRVCTTCRRSFLDDSINDIEVWLDKNLDAEVQPQMWLGHGVLT